MRELKISSESKSLNGIIIVNKPSNWTSHDVVNKTKRLLGGIKVGHTGTLDPFATGVMILLVGKATKLSKFFENDEKTYHAEITFGSGTDTYDCTGKDVASDNPERVNVDELKNVILSFNGETDQIPPMYSALKINGTRLYKLARKGESVKREPRKVSIAILETKLHTFPVIEIVLRCSKGTYVRSIAHDIGEAVGCPAHLSRLVRTASGNYTLHDAIDFQKIADDNNSTFLKNAVIPAEKLDFHGSH